MIVPPVIDHAYVVAPAGPEAVLPGEAVQTLAVGVVIVGVAGFALIAVVVLLEAEQPEALLQRQGQANRMQKPVRLRMRL